MPEFVNCRSIVARHMRLVMLSVALPFILTACEGLPKFLDPVDPQVNWRAHQGWLQTLKIWRVSGRVAVQVPDDGWSASLRWRQNDADYRISLDGPFGQGAVRIDGSPELVAMRTSDGQVRRAASPEELIAAELGANVPISLLRDWILGRPAPSQAVQELQLASDGLLESLSQAGWQIRYQEYQVVDRGELPSRFEIERGDTQARFVITRWRFGD